MICITILPGWRSVSSCPSPGDCVLCKKHYNMQRWNGFSSRHVCAAAKLLKDREEDLGGTVLLLFQPAEEGGAGGKKFVEEGALKGVSGIHGIHVWPPLPAGIIASRVSSFTALTSMHSVCKRPSAGLANCSIKVGRASGCKCEWVSVDLTAVRAICRSRICQLPHQI